MSQNLQNFVKFQKFQLENLVDFEKCCKTRIYLQKSASIQPRMRSSKFGGKFNLLFIRLLNKVVPRAPLTSLEGRIYWDGWKLHFPMCKCNSLAWRGPYPNADLVFWRRPWVDEGSGFPQDLDRRYEVLPKMRPTLCFILIFVVAILAKHLKNRKISNRWQFVLTKK